MLSVQFLDAATGWAVGDRGTILATTDGGRTWAAQTSPTGEVLYSVQFLDAATGWAVGTGGTILATTDGGRTWAAQTSPTGERLFSVQFLDAATGWAVGDSGTILKISVPDLTQLAAADTADTIRAAVEAAAVRFEIALEVELAKLDAINARIRAAEDIRNQLAASPTAEEPGKEGEGSLAQILLRAETIENWANRVGVVLLLMFLVAIFSALYRYNLRMAGFYDARADALELFGAGGGNPSLIELAQIFGPENIDFAKARSPAEQITELAKAALQRGK